MNYKNFSDFFLNATRLSSKCKIINWRNSENQYDFLTGRKLRELVFLAAKAIETFNINRGDKVAIISESRYEWVIADFACILNGLVTVPIYTTMTSEQIKFILTHSEAKICFVSNKALFERVEITHKELPNLKKIITFNKIESDVYVSEYFEDIIFNSTVHSKTNYSDTEADSYFIECAEKQNPDDLLTIIYTSGTTGIPKGVCLSHRNVLANIKQCIASMSVSSSDRWLSFLPLAHTYERTAGYYVPMSIGAEIYYAQSIETLQTQMAEVKPTVLLTVPLLFSKIKSRILKNIESLPPFKKYLAKKLLSLGSKYRNNKSHFLWKVADIKVFRTIRSKTGGALRFFVSGGSALNPEVAEFFDSIGLTILQGYGMTEASPVISVNRLDSTNKFDTVGKPLSGVEVKLGSDGEILVKGENVMRGYYKNEQDTTETIIDGWLHTGDIGEFDTEGRIRITDRKKMLIKTSGGKYISLSHIEDTLAMNIFIESAIVFATDERQYVVSLIVPNFEELGSWARNNSINFNNNSELIEIKAVVDFIQSELNKAQSHLAKYERVRRFKLMEKPFSIESGELTPTLKFKRKVIEERYNILIEEMYTGLKS